MKNKIFTLILFCFCSFINAQTKYTFSYDTAGNQTLSNRYLVTYTSGSIETVGKNAYPSTPTKFNPEDDFTYFPNPVKEQLFLKWTTVNNNPIKEMKVYNINGALLKVSEDLRNTNENVLSFYDYPTGTYIVNIGYENGDEKSITIIKQ